MSAGPSTEKPAGSVPGAAGARLRGSVAKVASASAIAQFVGEAVSLLQTVVLARLLTPTEVGLFAAGTVLTAFLMNFSEGGMRAAIVHRGDRIEDASETVFWGTLITGTLMSVAALAAAPLVGLVFDDGTAGLIAAVTSGGLVLYSLANVPEALLQRRFSVKRRLIAGPSVAISFAVTSVALAATGHGVWSLVIGSYVSQATLLVVVWTLAGWRPRRANASWALWRELARYGFPLVIGFVGARSQQAIEAVVVGRGLDTAALGFYRYGTRISRIPVNAILEIVAVALFPAFARLADDPDRLRAAYLKALGAVCLVAAAISGLIVAVGEPAVVVLLGEPWRGAGLAVVAMAGLGLGKAFTSVSEEALKGCGRTRLLNWVTAAEFVFGVGLLVLIIPFGLVGVGIAISATALIVGLLCLHLARPVVGVTVGRLAAIIGPTLIAGALAAAGTRWFDRVVVDSGSKGLFLGTVLLVVDAAVFVVCYLAVLAVLAPATLTGVRRRTAAVVRRRRRTAGDAGGRDGADPPAEADRVIGDVRPSDIATERLPQEPADPPAKD